MEISNDILKFIDWWFQNHDKWFANDPTIDKEILDKFGYLIDIVDTEIFKKKFDVIYYLGNILISDQLIRHFDRVHDTKLSKEFSTYAISCSQKILDHYPKFLTLTPEQQCFVLLPLRHSREHNLLKKCQEHTMKLIEMDMDNIPQIYLRFLKANMDCIREIVRPTYYPISDINWNEPRELLDKKCHFYPHHPIGVDINNEEVKIPTEWQDSIEQIVPKKKIIISLSGGGDSMVLSYLLHVMGYDVTAFMVDYGNRNTCPDEVKMVHYWCSRMDIDLYVLHMGEYLKRHNDERHSNIRAIYEDKTRRWRFNAYKYVAKEIGADNNIVILGHNKDDTIENIIANLCKRRSFTNLKGFRDTIVESNILLCRPIREVMKTDITAFANKANIPYLADSTPKWSFRGRTRDELIPFLDNFDTGLLKGLYHYSEIMQQQSEDFLSFLKENTIYTVYEHEIIVAKGRRKQTVQVIQVEYTNNYNEIYWTSIFETINRGYKLPMIGNKTIQKLIKEIKEGHHINRSLIKSIIIDVDPTKRIFKLYDRSK